MNKLETNLTYIFIKYLKKNVISIAFNLKMTKKYLTVILLNMHM